MKKLKFTLSKEKRLIKLNYLVAKKRTSTKNILQKRENSIKRVATTHQNPLRFWW
jgi:hypothetical protein